MHTAYNLVQSVCVRLPSLSHSASLVAACGWLCVRYEEAPVLWLACESLGY